MLNKSAGTRVEPVPNVKYVPISELMCDYMAVGRVDEHLVVLQQLPVVSLLVLSVSTYH